MPSSAVVAASRKSAAGAKSEGPSPLFHGLLCRQILFFWLFVAAALNSVIALASFPAAGESWLRAGFGLFGISAILWVAILAGGKLLLDAEQQDQPTRGDWAMAAGAAAAFLIPTTSASSAMMTALALYAIATSGRGSAMRRAGIIFLAISGATLWGRLMLGFFAHPLLDMDGLLVATLTGLRAAGNVVGFRNGAGSIAIAAGCSSFQGISLALVFWATLNQWFSVPVAFRSLIWAAAAVVATIAVNVLRIGALVYFPGHFEMIHTGIGWHVASWTTLLFVVSICLYGARDAIRRR
jgi:exosortase/archaeosortase family protein